MAHLGRGSAPPRARLGGARAELDAALTLSRRHGFDSLTLQCLALLGLALLGWPPPRMLTWRSIPAVDHDDGRPVTKAFVGAATVTFNRPVPASGKPAPSPKVVIVAGRAHMSDGVGPAHRRRGVAHTS